MAEAYAVALRERVVQAYEAGEGSYPVIAARFTLGEATVKRWVWRSRGEGPLGPTKKGGGTPSRITAAAVEALVTQLGDPTAGEITAAYNRTRRGRLRVHVSTMKRALHRFGYVVKKNGAGRWRRRGQTSRPSGAPS
jgi:transposase